MFFHELWFTCVANSFNRLEAYSPLFLLKLFISQLLSVLSNCLQHVHYNWNFNSLYNQYFVVNHSMYHGMMMVWRNKKYIRNSEATYGANQCQHGHLYMNAVHNPLKHNLNIIAVVLQTPTAIQLYTIYGFCLYLLIQLITASSFSTWYVVLGWQPIARFD